VRIFVSSGTVVNGDDENTETIGAQDTVFFLWAPLLSLFSLLLLLELLQRRRLA